MARQTGGASLPRRYYILLALSVAVCLATDALISQTDAISGVAETLAQDLVGWTGETLFAGLVGLAVFDTWQRARARRERETADVARMVRGAPAGMRALFDISVGLANMLNSVARQDPTVREVLLEYQDLPLTVPVDLRERRPVQGLSTASAKVAIADMDISFGHLTLDQRAVTEQRKALSIDLALAHESRAEMVAAIEMTRAGIARLETFLPEVPIELLDTSDFLQRVADAWVNLEVPGTGSDPVDGSSARDLDEVFRLLLGCKSTILSQAQAIERQLRALIPAVSNAKSPPFGEWSA